MGGIDRLDRRMQTDRIQFRDQFAHAAFSRRRNRPIKP